MKRLISLTEVLTYAREIGPKTVSIARADDMEVLLAADDAQRNGIAKMMLVGDYGKIKSAALSANIEINNFEVIDVKGEDAAVCQKAVELVTSGGADILMKGFVKTADFLRAVLKKENGFHSNSLLSHAYIHQIENYDRILFMSDPAFNMYPDITCKIGIIKNVVKLARAFGIEKPKVAVLAAVETINTSMRATLDAAILTQMNRRGQINDCVIDGPLAFDNAISPKSARQKAIESEVAGQADILLVPDIESGNMLGKSIIYFCRGKTAGLVLGAAAPIVLTSRSDSAETKLLSVASAVTLAGAEGV